MLDIKKEMAEYEKLTANKLKTVDVQTLEQAIAKAVGELIGVEFRCDIQSIKYSYPHQGASFGVSLSEPVENMLVGDFDSAD